MSGPPTTWAVTTWRHSWPARRQLTGSTSGAGTRGAGSGGRAGEGEAQAQVRPCLLPALTVRCCWDLCRPISSLCRNTRPTPTSSCRGGSGHWRVPLACEKTINFILLKLRPFCDPEAAPSCSQEPFLDPCPFPSPLPSQQLPSLSLPHSLKAPSCPHRASPMQVAAGAQRGLDHKEATGDYWGGGSLACGGVGQGRLRGGRGLRAVRWALLVKAEGSTLGPGFAPHFVTRVSGCLGFPFCPCPPSPTSNTWNPGQWEEPQAGTCRQE